MVTDGDAGTTALLVFRGSNAWSFLEEFELSFVGRRLGDSKRVREVPWHLKGGRTSVLPVVGVFGANASGKTNVLKAMHDMRRLVVDSFGRHNPGGGVWRRQFKLSPEGGLRPTCYGVELVLSGVKFEYEFSFDDDRILGESAYYYPNGKPKLLFERDALDIEIGASIRTAARAVVPLVRPNALVLSTAAAANVESLMPLYRWFDNNLSLAQAGNRDSRLLYTAQLIDREALREQVMAMVAAADLGIVDLSVKAPDPKVFSRVARLVGAIRDVAVEEDEAPFEVPDPTPESFLELELVHRGLDVPASFEINEESLGTRVWLGLIGPVVEALRDGSVLLADELDASLHPALVEQLVLLFQNQHINRLNAQLVFNSFDPELLGDSVGERVLGRDQVWFCDKNYYGASRLYALSDFHPRKEESISRRYREGRYGAVPIISREDFEIAGEMAMASDLDE